jgi:hypothetical protein
VSRFRSPRPTLTKTKDGAPAEGKAKDRTLADYQGAAPGKIQKHTQLWSDMLMALLHGDLLLTSMANIPL